MNNKSLEVVSNACQSIVLPVWPVKSDWSVKPLVNGIGCNTRVKVHLTPKIFFAEIIRFIL